MTDAATTSRAARGALLLILAVAFALRVWNLDFGLDRHDVSRAVLVHQQDEVDMAGALRDGILRGNLFPGRFMIWGAANFFLFGLVDLAVLGPIALLRGEAWIEVLARLAANPSDLHLLQRATSAAASLLMVLLVWRMLRREAGERAGLAGAALLAAAYLSVREAHFGTLDTCLALWMLLAIDRGLLIVREGSLRHYLWAGLFGGIATATKQAGFVGCLPIVAAHLLARREAARAGPSGARPPHARLLAAGAVAVATFALLSTHIVYATEAWRAQVQEVTSTIGLRWDPPALLAQAGQHLRYTLWVGAGEPVFALGLLGAVLAWRRGGPLRLLPVALVLLLPMFFLAMSRSVRYGVPHVALLAALAGLACDRLASALAGARGSAGQPSRTGGWLLAALLVLASAPSLLRDLYFNRALGERDTRLDVQEHLARAGATPPDLLLFGLFGLRGPPFAPGEGQSLNFYGAVHRVGFMTKEQALALRPRFVLRDESAPELDRWGWDEFRPAIEAEYRPVLQVDGRVDPAAVALPEPAAGTPGFMLPYENPWAMSRPGPPLTLYERVGG
ncbi:MAG TPA: glycosyltransferase family 39 protein [Planctomycetota bacterium]|nr:glycosyltransferase family 39 protein [Planctomycetota bacterium]